ncbi:O-acyltransferase [Bacteroidia bacterium]|nr:O-acyltransferase [Bacteroidia bacterium]
MLFNSFKYLVFLPIVFILYWAIKPEKYKWQNVVLIIASYIFYGWWDYRFLFLLIFSTSLDYFTGLQIFQAENHKHKKIWLLISICINLGFLGFFKYYNFFIDSFAELLATIGFNPSIWTLRIILPVGISFYTFHGLSYVLDIFNGKIKPAKDFIDYSLFVGFFPLLVAGPIERATHLLPQLQKPRYFNPVNATDGLRQIIWGFFKKIVIADNCAIVVNTVFENYTTLPASSLAIGALFFSFQIYGDFSGYSDIALGSARLFGIELLRNFSYPYFSRDIAEFWRRWHISLTTWFRDYLYIPLGGSKGSRLKTVRNTFIIFLVSGFWHGANWTFIVWGLMHALFFLPLLLLNTNRKNVNQVAENKIFPSLKELLQMVSTFILTTFAWIVFRSESISQAFSYIANLFSCSLFSHTRGISMDISLGILLLLFICAEWVQRKKPHALQLSNRIPAFFRWCIYYGIVFFILLYGKSQQSFIYFQF